MKTSIDQIYPCFHEFKPSSFHEFHTKTLVIFMKTNHLVFMKIIVHHQARSSARRKRHDQDRTVCRPKPSAEERKQMEQGRSRQRRADMQLSRQQRWECRCSNSSYNSVRMLVQAVLASLSGANGLAQTAIQRSCRKMQLQRSQSR